MALFFNKIAIAVLLVSQASASQCAGGSCTDDYDVTSLVQVKKLVKTDRRQPDYIIEEAEQVVNDGAPGIEAVSDVPMMEDTQMVPGENRLLHAIHRNVDDHRWVHDAVRAQNRFDEVDQNPIPPPAGQGNMEDNDDVVWDGAVTATMPGEGDSVDAAFDGAMQNSVEEAKSPIWNQAKRDMAHIDQAVNSDRQIYDNIHAQRHATAEAYQNAADSVTDTLATSNAVTKEAIHTVQDAKKEYLKTAITRDQTRAAALAGHEVGLGYGEQEAEDQIAHAVNERTDDALNRVHNQAVAAREAEIEDGITAADDALSQRDTNNRIMVQNVGKQEEAVRADVAATAGVVNTDIAGAQHIKNALMKQAAERQAAGIMRDSEHMENDIQGAMTGGAYAVAHDMEADAISPQNAWGDAAVISPAAGMGGPDIVGDAISFPR